LIDGGKKNILGVLVDVVDYETVVQRVLVAGRRRHPIAVTALAVHGVMTGYLDPEHKYRLNNFDLVVPDGQPVRWALNWIYKVDLRERVYGPNLMVRICAEAEREKLPVYFYGSTNRVISKLKARLKEKFPRLEVAGSEPSLFRPLTDDEKRQVTARIHGSGAALVFVGLGCPRQEVWAYEFRVGLSLPVISVGAAFPYYAGILAQAPLWMQRHGLEWVFRFSAEPRRLWRRYLLLNPLYLVLVSLQAMGFEFGSRGSKPERELMYG
jgi:N-acetylglucosaminyldiphosphoundecaprenol N-acetyl-beta-D-mannosaminyltransferase